MQNKKRNKESKIGYLLFSGKLPMEEKEVNLGIGIARNLTSILKSQSNLAKLESYSRGKSVPQLWHLPLLPPYCSLMYETISALQSKQTIFSTSNFNMYYTWILFKTSLHQNGTTDFLIISIMNESAKLEQNINTYFWNHLCKAIL